MLCFQTRNYRDITKSSEFRRRRQNLMEQCMLDNLEAPRSMQICGAFCFRPRSKKKVRADFSSQIHKLYFTNIYLTCLFRFISVQELSFAKTGGISTPTLLGSRKENLRAQIIDSSFRVSFFLNFFGPTIHIDSAHFPS